MSSSFSSLARHASGPDLNSAAFDLGAVAARSLQENGYEWVGFGEAGPTQSDAGRMSVYLIAGLFKPGSVQAHSLATAMSKPKRPKSTAEWRTRPGATFAVPLANGRFGACRILRVDPEREMSLFAATQYVGKKPLSLGEPLLASILSMDSIGADRATQRTAGDNWRCVWWQHWCEPPPADFRYLGIVEPTQAEQRMNPDAYSKFWSNWGTYILQEWRWHHDRHALIKELEERNGVGSVQKFLEEKKSRAEMTLAKLRKKRFFADWDDFVPPSTIRAARRIVNETIDRLIAQGLKPTKRQALPILRQFMKDFNNMADNIDSISRENICDAFDEIIRVAGLKGCDKLAEKWRDF